MTEAELLANIKELAAWTGWRCYHTYDSRRSDKGFPDLVLVRDGRLIVAELKSTSGRLTHDQAEWIADLRQARVDALVWRPDDWPTIEAMLCGRAPSTVDA